jgi:hypothetical protein
MARASPGTKVTKEEGKKGIVVFRRPFFLYFLTLRLSFSSIFSSFVFFVPSVVNLPSEVVHRFITFPKKSRLTESIAIRSLHLPADASSSDAKRKQLKTLTRLLDNNRFNGTIIRSVFYIRFEIGGNSRFDNFGDVVLHFKNIGNTVRA